MATKISEELSQRLSEVENEAEAASQKELPVIITLKEASDLAPLEEQGLKVQRTFDNISAVAGTLPAAAVKSVARLDEVEHIDYDGEFQALPEDAEE